MPFESGQRNRSKGKKRTGSELLVSVFTALLIDK